MSLTAVFALALGLSIVSIARADVVPIDLPGGFDGPQSGYGSWFQADIGRDSTNGNSWCGYPYKNIMYRKITHGFDLHSILLAW